MMTSRRQFLVCTTGGLGLLAARVAWAQSWKQTYPELVFAVIPAENASGVTERYKPFVEYLTGQLGTKVTLRIASDYAAAIEGQRAGNIHIAQYGPASYVRAWTVTKGGVEPFVTSVNNDGSTGYYSVAFVRVGDSAQSIQDLKGKKLGLVDPNSTSGNNVPRMALHKMGIEPDKFFERVVYTGSHENAILALKQGTVDAAFNWWNSDTDSNLTRMVTKGMAKKEDYRIIFKSDLIMNSPVAYLASLPADLKQAIVRAFVDAPAKNKAVFDRLSDGKDLGFKVVTHKDYEPIVELQDFVDKLRKQRG